MEKAPRKKEKRPVKKGAALLTLLCLAVLAGAAAYFLRPGAEAPAGPLREEQAVLLDRSVEEISALAIRPEEGAAYRLIRGEAGFFLEGDETLSLRKDIVEEMGLMASVVKAENTVRENARGEALGAYGLASPACVLTVTYTDGEEKTVLFGDLSPQETPQRYVMLRGDDRVFTVLEAECTAFFHDRDYLRDFAQPKLNGSLLDRICVRGEKEIDLRYTESGWLMEAPWRYPAASARMNTLLSRISAMAFDACLGKAEEAELSDYGLDTPALTVTLTQAKTVIRGETAEGQQVTVDVPEREYTLLIGNETGKSGLYLLWENQVFRASNFLLGFWKEMDAESLLSQQPVSFQVNDLQSVSLTAGDAAGSFRVAMVESVTENNQIATDEYGRTLYECEITRLPGGEAVDQEAFLTWYASLSSLRPAGRLPEGYALSGGPEAVLTLESGALTREIALYPYDALHDALTVDGTALYYVSREWLNAAERLP